MSCYHPLKAFPVGKTVLGKTQYKVTSYDVDCVSYNGSSWVAHPYHPGLGSSVTDFIEIPCGQCIGCRLDHAREWANRCMVEASKFESNYFLTLTYDDDHIHTSWYGKRDTGEAVPDYTLFKKDLQDFWKRLRSNTGQDIRYFACGEYGDNTFRPHYHAIVFNLVIDDLERFGGSSQFPTFTSKSIQKIWKNGNVLIADCSYDTCAYVSRYVTKKATGPLGRFYDYYNLEPEFLVMSRRPGIGRDFYDKSLFDEDYITFATSRKGIKFKPPRYYKKLLEFEDPLKAEELRQKNLMKAEMFKAAKLSECSYSYLEMLSIEERNKKKELQKCLNRTKV